MIDPNFDDNIKDEEEQEIVSFNQVVVGSNTDIHAKNNGALVVASGCHVEVAVEAEATGNNEEEEEEEIYGDDNDCNIYSSNLVGVGLTTTSHNLDLSRKSAVGHHAKVQVDKDEDNIKEEATPPAPNIITLHVPDPSLTIPLILLLTSVPGLVPSFLLLNFPLNLMVILTSNLALDFALAWRSSLLTVILSSDLKPDLSTIPSIVFSHLSSPIDGERLLKLLF